MASLRTRSLGGCATCRSRRTKCDETRPVCNVCRRLGLACHGYASRLTFVLPGQPAPPQEPDDVHFRRPLFTEDERLTMSDDLRASMRHTPPARALARLDDRSQHLDPASGDASRVLSHGPFAVFVLPVACTTPPSSDDPACLAAGHPLDSPDISLLEPADGLLPADDYAFDAALGDLDQFWDAAGAPLCSSAAQCEFPSWPADGAEDHPAAPNPSLSPASLPLPFSPGPMADRDAGFLLMHYKNHVIRLMSPLKYHRKTPWNVLQLPCAMNTLAELTMGYQANHARTAVFLGLLAISAFNLSTKSPGTAQLHWAGLARAYKARSHDSLKSSLKHELSGPNKAKYKDILMAILSMVTISAFSGSVETTRPYLLDAERLIRLRGLPKPNKSRKLRLLHHCYGYLRIMYETTALAAHVPGQPPDMLPTDTCVSFNPSSSFRVVRWDSELQMHREKDTELGHSDIHLEVPGQWPATLYPDVYGIPESLIVLISQATRLGNQRDAMRTMPDEVLFTPERFFQRAKAVERHICRWTPPSQNYPAGYDASINSSLVDSNRRVIDHLLLALHQALIIYFYRRVYDMEPLVLQPNVTRTIHHLQQIQDEDEATGGYTVGIVWPGFIAACEALEPQLQQRFLDWFDASERNSGLPTFEAAAKVAKAVWRKREETGESDFSWSSVIQEQQTTLFCT